MNSNISIYHFIETVNSVDMELRLHTHFNSKRIPGNNEWFMLNEDDLKFIMDVKNIDDIPTSVKFIRKDSEQIRLNKIKEDKITDIKDSTTAETAIVPARQNTAYACDLFSIPKADFGKHKDAYPGVNVPAEYRKMSAWLSANPQKRPRNYPRFINNWLAREQDRVAIHGSKRAPEPFRNRNVAAEQVEQMMRDGKTFDDLFPEKVK